MVGLKKTVAENEKNGRAKIMRTKKKAPTRKSTKVYSKCYNKSLMLR